ncbi:MAG: hypothetical protein NT120_01450 [Candidatus Aenigmarchaeota archaeon]|nr:hypothetical protein [Candidatus Aenigmarchaeota archaeon]
MAKLLSLFFIILVAGVALASNFGSSTKGDTITLKENQSGSFDLLFWTTENITHNVILNKSYVPDNFEVLFEKNEFNISSTKGNEMVYKSGGYIKATSIKVFVNQIYPKPGNYSILISSIYSSGEGDITTKQERTFNLAVNVEGVAKNETIINGKGNADLNPLAYVAILIIIIFILFVVIK